MNGGGPLEGLVVVDLSRVLAGPYATMVLADLGARVIKVEAPMGDDARHFGPFVGEKSAYFMSLNRGKESIRLDLKAVEDRAIFTDLVTAADVLVENYRPGTLEKLGFGWDALRALNPRLIYGAVSGFGHTGPYRERAAYDMVVQAMGGIMSVTGHPGGPPTRVGTSVGDITAGLFAVAGILSALYERERTGKGAMVDVAMLDCQVAILENAIARYFADGQVPGPLGARHPSITPFEAVPVKDGYIVIAAGNDTLFKTLCEAIDRPDLGRDPDFATNALRTENHARLTDELTRAFAHKDGAAWLDILASAGVPCGPINDVAQVLSDPHVQARNMVISTQDDDVGSVRMAGNPVKNSNHGDPRERPSAPDLDGDRDAVLAFLKTRPSRRS